MKGRRALVWVVVMSSISVGGILGLLFATGIWDGLFLGLAAVPLAVGLWRWRTQAGRHLNHESEIPH